MVLCDNALVGMVVFRYWVATDSSGHKDRLHLADRRRRS